MFKVKDRKSTIDITFKIINRDVGTFEIVDVSVWSEYFSSWILINKNTLSKSNLDYANSLVKKEIMENFYEYKSYEYGWVI